LIVFLTNPHHRYTHRSLDGVGGLSARTLGYEEALGRSHLPRATYVFTDMDRLGYWELELAARLYRTLARAGCRVLNDPALLPGRLTLLRRLYARGLNSFSAWALDEAPADLPFPVFLRTDSAHRGVLGDLISDRAALDAAVTHWLGFGIPSREIIIVEYRAKPVREGLFHKRAMFRIGERMVPSLGVFESRWCAKHGEMGIAGEALYEAEQLALERMDDAAEVRRAFEIAGIEYGRADYAVVDGRVELYEINTNPSLPSGSDHPYAARRAAGQMARSQLLDALRTIDDTPEGGTVAPDDPVLVEQRRQDRWVWSTGWRP
jgi:hypothetical protein